jgi:hypothetical protein
MRPGAAVVQIKGEAKLAAQTRHAPMSLLAFGTALKAARPPSVPKQDEAPTEARRPQPAETGGHTGWAHKLP